MVHRNLPNPCKYLFLWVLGLESLEREDIPKCWAGRSQIWAEHSQAVQYVETNEQMTEMCAAAGHLEVWMRTGNPECL